MESRQDNRPIFEEDILEFFEKEGNSFLDMIEHDYLNRTFQPYDQAFYMNLLKRYGSKYHRLTVKEIDKIIKKKGIIIKGMDRIDKLNLLIN